MKTLRKAKRSNYSNEELDITSLMDILFILLFFLIQKFNSSDFNVNVIEELALPYSRSQEAPKKAVVLQINEQLNVYINSELVGNLKDNSISEQLANNLQKIPRLNEQDNQINLLIDKSIKYDSINKLLRIVDNVGYSKYKLIVSGDS